MSAPDHLKTISADRQSLNRKAIYALRDAMHQPQKRYYAKWERETISGYLLRLELCNSDHNRFEAEDMNLLDSDELFDGVGKFWSCNSRLCPECTKRLSIRNRKIASRSIANSKLYTFENYHFITLTMPHNNQPLKRCREIINYAWSLLRKREFFKVFSGGIKSEEFTFTKNGYHYHLHLLVKGKYFKYDELRAIWTDCLMKAFSKFGNPFNVRTKDKRAIIKCIKIPPTQKALKSMTFELTKYITKSDSWNKVPPEDLLEIALTARFPRMFELFGSFRVARDSPIVHKQEISDGENSQPKPERESWRETIYRKGIETYASQLNAEFIRCKSLRIYQISRKYPYAKIYHTPDFIESWDNYV